MSKLNLCAICKHCRSLNYCEEKHKFGNDNKYECQHLYYQYDIYRRLHHLIKERDEAIKEVDERLCELIIDDCGYDPKTESHTDLVDCVKANSERCDEILTKLREVLK